MFYVFVCLSSWNRAFQHYDDVIMTMQASQITSLAVVYSIVYSGVNQRKHQSSASLAFVREIHRGPVNFPHKWPVTRKNVSIWWRHHELQRLYMQILSKSNSSATHKDRPNTTRYVVKPGITIDRTNTNRVLSLPTRWTWVTSRGVPWQVVSWRGAASRPWLLLTYFCTRI